MEEPGSFMNKSVLALRVDCRMDLSSSFTFHCATPALTPMLVKKNRANMISWYTMDFLLLFKTNGGECLQTCPCVSEKILIWSEPPTQDDRHGLRGRSSPVKIPGCTL